MSAGLGPPALCFFDKASRAKETGGGGGGPPASGEGVVTCTKTADLQGSHAMSSFKEAKT